MSHSVDLRTRYLGLELRNPIVASASPLTGNVDSLKRLRVAVNVGDDRETRHGLGGRGLELPSAAIAVAARVRMQGLPLTLSDRRGEGR